MPAFSSPIDCTPWVTGGLWPAELSTVTAETATLAEHLKADLQRIAHAANDELKLLKRAGMAEPSRQAAEARVIEEARARAVRRVESTIRYLHTVQSGGRSPAPSPPRPQASNPDLDKTQVLPAVRADKAAPEAPAPGRPEPTPPARRWRRRESAFEPDPGSDSSPAAGREPAEVSHLDETQVIPVIRAEPVLPSPPEPAPEPASDQADSGRHHAVVEPSTERNEPEAASEPAAPADVAAEVAPLDETQVIPVITQPEPEPEPVPEVPVRRAPEPAPDQADSGRHHAIVDEPVTARAEPEVSRQEVAAAVTPDAAAEPAAAEPASAEPETAAFAAIRPPDEKPLPPKRFDDQRLNRLLEFVVRQEPRLNWAIGDRADGTTILVTDLAHGWIPSGISLPAGVRLLEPERRSGRVAALIGETARVVTYTPGDSLRRSADFAATRSSVEPRALPVIDDLANVLSAAIRGRDDLPKIVPRLAQAAAAGTVVVDQEVDVLRVHLDTARYQLLVQYPNVNPALLLKCLLMAATEGIASGDSVSANYHLAWYQKLVA
jgi:hypothetical protein